jgi:hypothetical protein
MLGNSQSMVAALREFLGKCEQNTQSYAEQSTDFTRSRKLPFSRLIVLQIGLLKKVSSPN